MKPLVQIVVAHCLAVVVGGVGEEDHLSLPPGRCWGYEEDCSWGEQVGDIKCLPGTRGWAGEKDPRKTFHNQADFGFLREKLSSLRTVCQPRGLEAGESQLKCSKNLEFCTATNLVINFTAVASRVATENLKYRMDILGGGDVVVSGCDLDQGWLEDNLDRMSPLQSWAPELQHLSAGQVGDTQCDLTIEEPTVIAKLDAGVNMYHHFCDFFNLYLSTHLNYSISSLEAGVWDTDKQVLILENIPSTIKSPFAPAWKAFSSLPLLDLTDVAGKVVCVKRAMFPLLARMIFGLYYNTPLIEGCEDSEMVRRFSQFLLGRLDIPQYGVLADRRLRVTLLSRDKARRILNERDLVEALQQTGHYKVTVARFSPHVPFQSQLTLTHNTDLLVGLHGAGLTHLLFLPDWAEVLELYNCEDPACYRDLTRLRGLGYTTSHWAGGTKMRTEDAGGSYRGPAHKKFLNYEFDPAEFVEIVNTIRARILRNAKYRKAHSSQHEEL